MWMNARITLVVVAVSLLFLPMLDVSHNATTPWALITVYALKDMFLNMMALLVKVKRLNTVNYSVT